MMRRIAKSFRLLPRAALLAGFLGGPLLFVPAIEAGQSVVIEATSKTRGGGIGFVLLVSLQR